MKYEVKYKNQIAEASVFETLSPRCAASMFFLFDRDKIWHNYSEVIVSWGALASQRVSFPVQEFIDATLQCAPTELREELRRKMYAKK